jgi:hypothetical protein
MATLQPRRARVKEHALPIPRDPPVTTAVLPLKSSILCGLPADGALRASLDQRPVEFFVGSRCDDKKWHGMFLKKRVDAVKLTGQLFVAKVCSVFVFDLLLFS